MKHYLVLLSFFGLSVIGYAQQEFVVQSNHSSHISASAFDSKKGILITYGSNDKTLKFWDESSGLLYKTIDLQESISSIEINEKESKLYTLGNNTITVYSTTTFEMLKTYQLERIYAIHFPKIKGKKQLMLLARDQNYMTSLYSLDEKTGEYLSGNIPPIPTDIEISKFSFSDDGNYLFISPAYDSRFLYSFEKKEYTELKGDFIAIFNNGDVLRAVYDQSNKKAVYMRMDPNNWQVKWNQTLTWDHEIEGLIAPTVFDVHLTNNGENLWVETFTIPLTQLNANTGEINGSFPKDYNGVYALQFKDNYIYGQFGSENKYGKYTLFNRKPIATYGHDVVEPSQTIGFQNGDAIEVLFSSNYGAKTYSLFAHPSVTQFTKYKTNYRDDFSTGKMIADPTSDKVFAITSTVDPIKVFNRGKSDSFKDLIANKRNVQQYDFSPNTKLLATLSNRGLRIINTESKTEVFYESLEIETGVFDNMLSLSPTSNTIAYTSREIQGDQIMYSKMHYYDFASKTEKWTKDGKYFGMFHINGGKEILVTNGSKGEIQILEANSGNVLKSFSNGFENYMMDTVLSPNEDYLLYFGFNVGATLFHIPSGKKIHKLDINPFGKFNGTFITNTIIAFPDAGALKFIDVLNQKEVLRLYIFDDESWVAYTPEGQFDGSQDGWDKVAFIKNKKTIPLKSVFDQFYTPRLIYQVLADKSFKSNINLESMAPPPSISLNFKQGTRNLYVTDDETTKEITVDNDSGKIFLEANANGDKVKEIRLYQNGKLVGNRTRNLFVEDDISQDPNKKEIEIQLIEGLNEFSAVAINSQGTESIPENLNVTFIPKQESLIKPQGIQAHLLVVGIDEYQNSKYNLNYAVADANGFQESVKNGLSNITSKTHVYFIKNSEAVRANIISKLNEIAAAANPQDIFIFYYAGHGVVTQNAEKEFYIVPSDVTQLYGDDGALKQKGIAASELKKVASGIIAQKQLYILDACQSAGALASVAMRGAIEEKAIAQLARSTGTHWLTASGSQQYATEFDELGHGVFTYALLEALSGKADSGDKRVTVNELKAYIESRVPEISEKYKGSPQYPSSFGFGQDFPVSTSQ